MLARLVSAKDDPHTRWFVLSDHGHLAGGGHGGPEDSIRIVRGCIFGAGIEPLSGQVHLVDFAATLFASLGVARDDAAVGRPVVPVASGRVALDSTLPSRPPWPHFLFAAILLLAAGYGTHRLNEGRYTWPWWFVAAYASLLLGHGVPTLSMPLIYPPQGRDLYVLASPGLFILAGTIALCWKGSVPWRLLASQLLVPTAATIGAFALANGHHVLLGGPPHLVPHYTAHASAFLILTYVGAAAAVLAVLARAGLSWFGRDSAWGSQRTDS